MKKIKERYLKNKKYYDILGSNILSMLEIILVYIIIGIVVVKFNIITYEELEKLLKEKEDVITLSCSMFMFMNCSLSNLYHISKLCKENNNGGNKNVK